MANLQRSISVSTTTMTNLHRNNLYRSISVGGHSALSYDMIDIYAQLEKFVKKYVLLWDLGPDLDFGPDESTILRNASILLPKIASRLSENRIEDLKLAIDILRNILHNLPQTLKAANQGCQELSRYLQQAINRGNQAARVYAAQNENFQFGPIVHEDLHTSNDVMAVVLLMKQYFYNLSNCIND